VKLRDVPRIFRRESQPRIYPSACVSFTLPVDGEVRFARWLHPGEEPKHVAQEDVDALREFLRPGDVAVDIGAHTGDSTVPIALAVGREGVVFALEPNPYVFEVLAANASLNPTKTRIVPLNFAAMETDGTFTFRYTDDGYCNGGFHRSVSRWIHGHLCTLRVEGRNVRAYMRRHAADALARLRYIKVDTEGHDPAVVASLGEVLRTARPYLKTEIYKHMPSEERIAYYDELRSLDYRLFRCERRTYKGQELDRRDVTRWRHFDIFAIPLELA